MVDVQNLQKQQQYSILYECDDDVCGNLVTGIGVTNTMATGSSVFRYQIRVECYVGDEMTFRLVWFCYGMFK